MTAPKMLLKLENNPRVRVPTRLHNMIGDFVYLKLGKNCKDAERAYRRAIELHPENAEAYVGLSTIYRRRGQNQEAIDAALPRQL